MTVVEALIAILLLSFIVFLCIHAVIYKMEETRAWNRRRIVRRRILQRRARRESKNT